MTEPELQQQRAHKWRLQGDPVHTLEQARAFLEDVGFCLLYPERTLPALPTFMGAYVGSAEGLPDARHAFADPRAQQATELMVRLLRERGAYELHLFGDASLIVAASLFPFFYALVGDRNPKAPPKTKAQGAAVSQLSGRVFEALQKHGPMSKGQLQEAVGREMSIAALDNALSELWTILKITRVDYNAAEGSFWDVFYRWSPGAVREGVEISAPEAVSALLCKYLETAIAATQDELEQFLSHLTPRSKVREAMNALLAARELSFVTVGAKTFIQLAPVVEPRRRTHV
jgi:hypothetical protein